jgi:hypothetical protein
VNRDSHPSGRICTQCGRDCLGTARGWRCYPCLLDALVAACLDDGTGRVNPTLQPVAALLSASTDVGSTIAMLRHLDRGPAKLLAEIAAGRVELSHEGLDAYGTPRATTKVRHMLVCTGVLPAIDPTVLDFERFSRRRLAILAGHPHQRLLRQFALWQQLPRMRAKAARRTLTYGAFLYAQQQFLAGESFLTWLVDKGLQPGQLSQAQLEAWLLQARRAERERVRGFLTWAMATRHLPVLTVHVVPSRQREPITQPERLDLLGRLATDDTAPLPARTVALLVPLYAQPLSRIRTLTIDDISVDADANVYIGLGDPPSHVPALFAGLLLELAHRDQPNLDERWLLPGRNPGQPLNYMTLRKMLASVGVAPRRTRVRALRQLVLDIPAAVVATALGYHQTTTHRQNLNIGGIWNRYAASH